MYCILHHIVYNRIKSYYNIKEKKYGKNSNMGKIKFDARGSRSLF